MSDRMALSMEKSGTPVQLVKLYESYTGQAPDGISLLSSSGSHRKYYRISGGGTSMIGVSGIDPHENRTFCEIARHFASKGIHVPEVYAVSGDDMYYLQEDLGDETLFNRISAGRMSGRYSKTETALIADTVRQLPVIQIEGADGLDFGKCYPKESFDSMSVMFDLHYFKYCFLKNTGIDFNEVRLEEDFGKYADMLLSCPGDAFMYRDFQSRNILMKGDVPYFIDFQDGRKGPVYYDLASFVWQARSAFPDSMRKMLVSEYIASMRRYGDLDVKEFMGNLRIYLLFRTLQVLGAYGFRGYMERKRHFIDSIPYAIRNLSELLSGTTEVFDGGLLQTDMAEKCPYLLEVLSQMVSLPGFVMPSDDKPAAENGCDGPADNVLEVEITSFSYRKGIPADSSGNGGGYVFDCRAIHNPGKYEQYRTLTGADPQVKAFLEQNGEVFPFMENVYALVDAHIEKFLKRGFTHLSVNFGCTGGRHRSVYCAEALANHLSGRRGVRVSLNHREQSCGKQ